MTLYAFNNKRPEIKNDVFVAPTAQIVGDVKIGSGSSVWFQSVIRGDLDQIRIGNHTNIQDLCTCHADPGVPLSVGNQVTIGHRCVIHGCTIEDNCLIGMGAIIMNGAVIKEGCVIAAGSVVLENTTIPPFSLVTGIPGKIRPARQSPKEIHDAVREMSNSYTDTAETYRDSHLFYPVD